MEKHTLVEKWEMAGDRDGSNGNDSERNRTVPMPVVFVATAGVLMVAGILLYAFFSQQRKPPEPVPRVRPFKRDYKFQEHLEGPYPFEYEPPVQPGKLADMLREPIEFGSYRLDDEKPLTGKNREPAANPPTLSDQGWHPKKRSYRNLLGAFRDRLPKALASKKVPGGPIRAACKVAVSEDAAAAVAFAEANLRLAPPKKLPGAINRLAASYWLGREYDRLDALLEAGGDYRPTTANCSGFPDELAAILRSVARTGRPAEDVRPKAVALQLALIRGDLEKAEAALEKIKKEKMAETYAPLVERLRAGLNASAGKPKHRKRMEKAFSEARHQLEDAKKPLHKRFADWPIQRLEKHLAWTVNALGGYCDPVADILAYMVEQRDYRRVKINSGTALIAAKRLAHRGEPARALPMYLLCQKLGYLSEDGRFDEDGPGAMVAFNGFEAPVYFVKTITGYPRLRKYVKGSDAIYRIAGQMYEYSLAHCRDEKSAGIAGRHGYEEVALKYRWDLALQTGRAEKVLDAIKKARRAGPTIGIRTMAAVRLGKHYLYRTHQYEKAANTFADLALGENAKRKSAYGLLMLRGVATAAQDKSFARRCRTVAAQLLKNHRHVMSQGAVERAKSLQNYVLQHN